jgi:hypothetical protein
VQEAVDKLAEGAGNKVEYLTQEEYDALSEDKLTNNVEYRILDSGTPTTARNVGYDGTASGIDAVNVQGAIDKVSESLGEFKNIISQFYVAKSGEFTSVNGTKTITVESMNIEEVTVEMIKDSSIYMFKRNIDGTVSSSASTINPDQYGVISISGNTWTFQWNNTDYTVKWTAIGKPVI